MFYLFSAIVTSLWSIKDHHTFIRDIYTSTFSVAYFLVFGTQYDVFRAWCFWRKDTVGSNPGTIEKEAGATEDNIVSSADDPSSESVFATFTELGDTHESFPAYSPACAPYTGATHYAPRNINVVFTSTRTEIS